jgi:hypothetical protein
MMISLLLLEISVRDKVLCNFADSHDKKSKKRSISKITEKEKDQRYSD